MKYDSDEANTSAWHLWTDTHSPSLDLFPCFQLDYRRFPTTRGSRICHATRSLPLNSAVSFSHIITTCSVIVTVCWSITIPYLPSRSSMYTEREERSADPFGMDFRVTAPHCVTNSHRQTMTLRTVFVELWWAQWTEHLKRGAIPMGSRTRPAPSFGSSP